jgi:Holliday junction resolvase RusA-like endonuclease
MLAAKSLKADAVSTKIYIVPLAKGRPRMTRQGRVYTPQDTRSFEADLRMRLFDLFAGPPMRGAIGLICSFFVLKPKSVRRSWPSAKPDIDNYIKALFDAGNGIIWEDDAQIVSLHAKKAYAEARDARIEITVWRMS